MLYRSMGSQREEKGNNNESGYRGYTDRRLAKGGEGRLKRADTEAVQIKGPQREEKDDNKENG